MNTDGIMRKSLSKEKRRVVKALQSLTNPRFGAVQRYGRGLLTPNAYKAIYERVRAGPDLDVIDVGSAGGASAVAAALAKKDMGSSRSVIAVEKCEGGTRSDYGGYNENRRFLERNFARFGVDKNIKLFPQYLGFDNASNLFSLLSSDNIAGFIHDADGRIDRDFQLFGPRLAEGGFVIIDDVNQKRKFQPISERYPLGGTKNVITVRLLDYFQELGLFQLDRKLGGVLVFGHAPEGADFSRIDALHCQSIVDQVMREHAAAFDEPG